MTGTQEMETFPDSSLSAGNPKEAPQRFIAHIDMDSFYASAEVARNPSLRDKPLIIGAEPKEGKGRGVVLTCNYHARRFGVRSAMPISEAWRLCPQAVYMPPDFEYYEELSGRVMELIGSMADRFEQMSIDEAFVDLTEIATTVDEALGWVARFKAELRDKTGLTCSVGLAENKSAAKIATDLKKPDGITVIPPGETRERLAPLPISVISGVGDKTEALFAENGVRTVGDLQRMELDSVKRLLGRSGVWLWEVANGIDRSEVVTGHTWKSMSTERTFFKDEESWEAVEKATSELAAELAQRVRDSGITFRRVGIKIRFKGFETHTRETMLPAHTNSPEMMRYETLRLLKEFDDGRRKVRLVGVRVSELAKDQSAAQQSSISSWIEGEGKP